MKKFCQVVPVVFVFWQLFSVGIAQDLQQNPKDRYRGILDAWQIVEASDFSSTSMKAFVDKSEQSLCIEIPDWWEKAFFTAHRKSSPLVLFLFEDEFHEKANDSEFFTLKAKQFAIGSDFVKSKKGIKTYSMPRKVIPLASDTCPLLSIADFTECDGIGFVAIGTSLPCCYAVTAFDIGSDTVLWNSRILAERFTESLSGRATHVFEIRCTKQEVCVFGGCEIEMYFEIFSRGDGERLASLTSDESRQRNQMGWR